MAWWDRDPFAFDHLVNALNLLNHIEAQSLEAEWEERVKALLQLAKGYGSGGTVVERGDGDSMRTIVADALVDDFFENDSFQFIARYISNGDVIQDEATIREIRLHGRKQGPRPLTSEELKKARRRHFDLIAAYETFRHRKSDVNRKKVGHHLGDVLWMVRCNLQKDGKYPGGPDLIKAERDKTVLAWTLPLLKDTTGHLLGNPENRFAVYGTLRKHRDPDEEDNHQLLVDLGLDNPSLVRVAGLKEKPAYAAPYPVFRWVLVKDTVAMELYESPRLPQYWARFDAFENNGLDQRVYKKIYVPITIEGRPGETVIASVFANAKS